MAALETSPAACSLLGRCSSALRRGLCDQRTNRPPQQRSTAQVRLRSCAHARTARCSVAKPISRPAGTSWRLTSRGHTRPRVFTVPPCSRRSEERRWCSDGAQSVSSRSSARQSARVAIHHRDRPEVAAQEHARSSASRLPTEHSLVHWLNVNALETMTHPSSAPVL
jgi:hypothetical protein